MKSRTYGLLVACCFGLSAAVSGQDQVAADTTRQTTGKREFKRLDIFPAISYTPETRLTLGAIGYYYLDCYRGDPSTKISNVNFLAIYTTASQIAIESRWEIFTNANRWRFRGEAFYNRYPDRNYGLGNDAAVLVAEGSGEDAYDTLNYFRFNSDRIRFTPVALRKIAPDLYIGLQAELETLYRLRAIPDIYSFVNADSTAITELPVEGFRSGLGFQLLYDTRDYVLNPIRGTYVEFSNLNFMSWLGSEYAFYVTGLDVRQYFNPVRNHTLALRAVVNFRFSGDPIPLRGLSRVGGHQFIRGYFKGTYQDNHLTAFELEYRLPFWPEDTQATFWQMWKRLGLVGFLSGAQVFHEAGDFRLNRFNMAAGGGLRILFNKQSRVNLRIDFAVGLRPDSNGPGKRQSGLYFYLAEAF